MGLCLSNTAFTTQNGKRRKISNAGEEEQQEEDIFDKLPESVITHILSFLPTKEAIRTSLLSKSWKNRWTSLTKLSLHDDSSSSSSSKSNRKRFVRFVNRALLLTDGLTMDHFSLFLSREYDWSLLDSWFSNIFNRRVKNLQIHSKFELVLASHSLFKNFLLLEQLELLTNSISLVNFPMSIQQLELLTNSISLNNVLMSIEVLELLHNSISLHNVPGISIRFRNLKILKLCGINFITDTPTSARFIHLRFPLLTKFEAKNCSWFVEESAVFIIAPLLQSISMEHYVGVPYKYVRSFIYFTNSLHLKEFSYCGSDIPQSILITSPCHASAKIILNKNQKSYMSDSSGFHLLKQFSHAKSIKFEASKVQKQPHNLCVFPLLTHLEVGLVNVYILLALLQKTPVLKALVLKGMRRFAEQHLNSVVVPDCLASSLHVVKFEEVNRYKYELYLATFFMKNGMVLERMCFSLVSQSREEKHYAMKEFKVKLKKLCLFNNFPFVSVELS